MAIVYQHIRIDVNEVFYIGIGKEFKRAFNKTNNRSKFWKNIINKTEYKIEILFNDLTWNESCQIEKYLIKYYGRKDLGLGTLVNLTNGGDGTLGHVKRNIKPITDEARKRMSDAQKRNGISKEQRDKMNSGFKNMSEESKLSMSKTQFKPKKVINIETNEIYNSVKEVSKLFNISYSLLKNHLSGKTKNATKFQYLENYDQSRI